MGGSNQGAALGDSPCCAFCAEAGLPAVPLAAVSCKSFALLSKCQRCEADLNAHPLSVPSKVGEDLEVRRSVNSLRSICSGLAPSADHDSEVAIHAG